MRKITTILIFLMFVASSIVYFVPENASAVNPTITNYGVMPTYGDVGSDDDSAFITFWMTYTDADNDIPTLTYPKATRVTETWPRFSFVANDTGDTNYIDGKKYYYQYWWYPVVGTTIWAFKVKSNSSAEIIVTVPFVAVLPSTPEPYNVYPYDNDAGSKTFTFNYTSAWGYGMDAFNGFPKLCLDGTNYTMIQNDTGDTTFHNGKDYYYTLNVSAGLHTFKFYWREQGALYELRYTGEHWLILYDEPDYNKFFVAIVLILLICVAVFILFLPRKQ